MLNSRLKKTLTLLLLFLGLVFGIHPIVRAQSNEEYFIDIRGFTWNHSTIKISILPQENESWWDPSYLNATIRAIAQWNEAIDEFATNYTAFSFMSNINLLPSITQEENPDFDVYISWIDACDDEMKLGLTTAYIESNCISTKSTVCLAAKAPSGYVMTEVDMQNLVTHELGHTLGLYHCNFVDDVMYYTYAYRNDIKPISSLDVYAVSEVFKWLSNSTQFSSVNQCPPESKVTLPSDIPYFGLQTSPENLPFNPPRTLADNIIEFFSRPEVQITIILTAFLLIVAVILYKKRPL